MRQNSFSAKKKDSPYKRSFKQTFEHKMMVSVVPICLQEGIRALSRSLTLPVTGTIMDLMRQ